MKLLSLRRAALLPALFALVACSDGPVAPEGEWAVGTWSFMTAACWPDFTVTPETLGHPVTLHLGANGRAWVDEGDGSVAHADFTVTERDSYGHAYLVLEFEPGILFSFDAYTLHQGESRDRLHLGMWEVADGCGYQFHRAPAG
jgi:hypothetical protein